NQAERPQGAGRRDQRSRLGNLHDSADYARPALAAERACRNGKVSRERGLSRSAEAQRAELEELVGEVEQVTTELRRLGFGQAEPRGAHLEDVAEARASVQCRDELERTGRAFDDRVGPLLDLQRRTRDGDAAAPRLELVLEPDGDGERERGLEQVGAPLQLGKPRSSRERALDLRAGLLELVLF